MKLLALVTASTLALAACGETVYVPVSGGSGGDGYNRVMDIVNQSGVTLTHFYASRASSNSWGPDQLGSSTVIYSGEYLTLNFDDGTGACVFDFKARMSGGAEIRRDNINVCVESSWTVY